MAHETSAIVLTRPLVVAFTALGCQEALVADAGLTLVYVACVFHLAFDRLRPVHANLRSH